MTLSERAEARLNEIERVARAGVERKPDAEVRMFRDGVFADPVLTVAWLCPEYVLDVLLPSWRERWARHCEELDQCGNWEYKPGRTPEPCPDALAVCREIGVPVDGERT